MPGRTPSPFVAPALASSAWVRASGGVTSPFIRRPRQCARPRRAVAGHAARLQLFPDSTLPVAPVPPLPRSPPAPRAGLVPPATAPPALREASAICRASRCRATEPATRDGRSPANGRSRAPASGRTGSRIGAYPRRRGRGNEESRYATGDIQIPGRSPTAEEGREPARGGSRPDRTGRRDGDSSARRDDGGDIAYHVARARPAPVRNRLPLRSTAPWRHQAMGERRPAGCVPGRQRPRVASQRPPVRQAERGRGRRLPPAPFRTRAVRASGRVAAGQGTARAPAETEPHSQRAAGRPAHRAGVGGRVRLESSPAPGDRADAGRPRRLPA